MNTSHTEPKKSPKNAPKNTLENAPKFYSLSRRIVLQFCIFTLALSLVYGCISFVLMYILEDSFIEKGVQQEAIYLAAEYQKTGIWPVVRNSSMQLHFSKATFPTDIREKFIQAPLSREFFGQDGRHYHLYLFAEHQEVYLTAEVSDDLLVRPIRESVIKFLSVSALTVTIIACLIAWLIGRKMARPLERLAELVDGVAPEHIPEQFAQQFPNNEIGILARTLEHTLGRMSKTLEREKCFTRDVSHELRTPLAVIKNALELHQTYLLGSQDAEAKKENAILKRVAESAEQMDNTVHTLLMLAREEHSAAKKEHVNLMSLVERSVLDNRMLLDGKQINIIIDDNCHTQIYAQAGMLKVLLDNLLSNAFQYTDSGEVRVNYIDKNLIVKDTGRGIDQAICNNVTEVGIKGHQSTGFGFGLSIVKRMCDQQGWQLTVTSDGGTSVVVTLE